MILTIWCLAMLLFLSIEDGKKKTVARWMLVLFIAGSIGLAFGVEGIGVQDLILGGVPGLALLLISLLTREKIGRGDAYAVIATGGSLGWQENLLALLVAQCLSAIYSIYLLAFRGKCKKDRFAFLPFLFIGVLVIKVPDLWVLV